MGYREIEIRESENGLTLDAGTEIVSGDGTTPFVLLLYSVASCSTLVLKSLLTKNGIDFSFDKTTCSGITEDRMTQKIDVTLYLSADDSKKATIERLVHKVPEFCTIVKSLSKDVQITETVLFI